MGFNWFFNFINQKALPLLKLASKKGMGIIARMPLQFGLLTGKFSKDAKFPETDHRSFRLNPEVLEQSLKDLEPVWPKAESYEIDSASFALSFILSHPDISTVIPGIKTPEQAISNTENICTLKKADIDILHELYGERFENLLHLMKEKG